MPEFVGPARNVAGYTVDESGLRGSFRAVADITARDAILATAMKAAGMHVFVRSEGLAYRLADDLVTWVISGDVAQTDAELIYVNSDTGNDTTGDGTSGAPYASLGKALEHFLALPSKWGAPVTAFLAGASAHYNSGTWTGRVQVSDQARLNIVGTEADVVVASGTTVAPSTVDGTRCAFPVGAATERRGRILKITSGAYAGSLFTIIGQSGNNLLLDGCPVIASGTTWQIVRPGTQVSFDPSVVFARGIGLGAGAALSIYNVEFVGDAGYGEIILDDCVTFLYGVTLSETATIDALGGLLCAGGTYAPYGATSFDDVAADAGLSVTGTDVESCGVGDIDAILGNGSYGMYGVGGCQFGGVMFLEGLDTYVGGRFLGAVGYVVYARFYSGFYYISCLYGGQAATVSQVLESADVHCRHYEITTGTLTVYGEANFVDETSVTTGSRITGRLVVRGGFEQANAVPLVIAPPTGDALLVERSGNAIVQGGANTTLTGGSGGWGAKATEDGQIVPLSPFTLATGPLGAVSVARDKNALSRANGDIPVNGQKITGGAAGVAPTDFAIVSQLGATGVTDHGALTGLGDDDHTQYQLRTEKNAASGYAGLSSGSKLTGSQQTYGTAANTACEGNDTRLSDARVPTEAGLRATAATLTADLSVNSHKVTSVTDPSSAQDAATKNYVDSVAPGWLNGTATAKVASFTFDATHYRKLVPYTHASAVGTATVPPNSSVNFPAGATLGLQQTSDGEAWITPGVGVTIEAMGKVFSAGQVIVLQGKRTAPVVLYQVAANAWTVVSGDMMPLPYGVTQPGAKYLRTSANPGGLALSTTFHVRGMARANAPMSGNGYLAARSNTTNAGWFVSLGGSSGSTPAILSARFFNGSGVAVNATSYSLTHGDVGRRMTWAVTCNGALLTLYINGYATTGVAMTTATDHSDYTVIGAGSASGGLTGGGLSIIDIFGLAQGAFVPTAAQVLQWSRDAQDANSMDVAIGGGTDAYRWVIDPDGQTATEMMGTGQSMAINSAGTGLAGSSRKPRPM